MKSTIEVKTVDGMSYTIFTNQIVTIINREEGDSFDHKTAIYTTSEKIIIRTNLSYEEVLALLD